MKTFNSLGVKSFFTPQKNTINLTKGKPLSLFTLKYLY